MIAAYTFLKADFQGGQPSAERTATEIRRLADEVDVHAAAMEASSRNLEAQMRRTMGAGVSSRLYESIATYRDSAELDRQAANVLRVMANLVERREDRLSPQFQDVFTRIEQLTIQRFEADTLRRALVAG